MSKTEVKLKSWVAKRLLMGDDMRLVTERDEEGGKEVYNLDIRKSAGVFVPNDLGLSHVYIEKCDGMSISAIRSEVPVFVTHEQNYENISYAKLGIHSLELLGGATLDNSAFTGELNLVSVDICNITKIGMHAFNRCTSLERVTIKNNVRTSELSLTNTFRNCNKLKSVVLCCEGEDFTINSGAFHCCTELEELKLPYLSEINQFSFESCKSLGDFVLNAKAVYGKAFIDCHIRNLVISDKVVFLADNCFVDTEIDVLTILEGVPDSVVRSLVNCAASKIRCPRKFDLHAMGYPLNSVIEYYD